MPWSLEEIQGWTYKPGTAPSIRVQPKPWSLVLACAVPELNCGHTMLLLGARPASAALTYGAYARHSRCTPLLA